MDRSSDRIEGLSFIDAIVGILLCPSESTEDLFDEYPPPYGITLLILFFIALFAPSLYIGWTFHFADPLDTRAVTLSLFGFVFLLTFIFFESMLLQLFGVRCSMASILSGVAYAVTPLTLSLTLMHGFNYMSSGSFTVAAFIAHGVRPLEDRFFAILPYALAIMVVYVFVVLFNVVRVLSKAETTFTSILVFLSAIPLIGATGASLILTDVFRPGSIDIIGKLFRGLLAF